MTWEGAGLEEDEDAGSWAGSKEELGRPEVSPWGRWRRPKRQVCSRAGEDQDE